MYGPHMKRFFQFLAIGSLAVATFAADQVVQIPVASILKTRTVTTLTNGKLVTWTPGGGIDGNGGGNGLLTTAASIFHGDKNTIALPDSSLIPANTRHPEMQLHYSNNDGTGFQTRNIKAADTNSFTITIPNGSYSKIFLAMTSAEGDANLRFTLVYTDTSVIKPVVLKDYGTGMTSISPTDTVLFYLIKNMGKWGTTNNLAEAGNHNIDGIELHPLTTKTLTEIKVKKMGGAAYVVFWGATGIATGPVGIGSSAAKSNDVFAKMHMMNTAGQSIQFTGLPSHTSVAIYNVQGNKVAQLNSSNSEKLTWKLSEQAKQKVLPGVYICQLSSGHATKNMQVLVTE